MRDVKIVTHEGRFCHRGFFHASRRAAARNVPLAYLTGLRAPARGEADFGNDELLRQRTNERRLYVQKRIISLAEIARRRLTVPPGWDEGELNFRVEDCDDGARLWLLVTRGFHGYGRHIRETGVTYLCGYEQQLFAVRVTSTVTPADTRENIVWRLDHTSPASQ